MYLPDVMLVSFDDSSTATSQVKLIRQSSSLDLGKLSDAYMLYWKAGLFYIYRLLKLRCSR